MGHLAHRRGPVARDAGGAAGRPRPARPCRRADPRVLVTGASGYLGSQVVRRWRRADAVVAAVALDVRECRRSAVPPASPTMPPTSARRIRRLRRAPRADVVVHLASIVTPGKDSNREFEHSVDVAAAPRNLLEPACATASADDRRRSSGAAYGYHADNPEWIDESEPLRGNRELRLLVAQAAGGGDAGATGATGIPNWSRSCSVSAPSSAPTVKNQITDLFDKPRPIAIRGADSPFVFIHDRDVVGAILHGIDSATTGIFNVAGDGKLDDQRDRSASRQALRGAAAAVAARRAVAAEEVGAHRSTGRSSSTSCATGRCFRTGG